MRRSIRQILQGTSFPACRPRIEALAILRRLPNHRSPYNFAARRATIEYANARQQHNALRLQEYMILQLMLQATGIELSGDDDEDGESRSLSKRCVAEKCFSKE